jgi:hypothetical protein
VLPERRDECHDNVMCMKVVLVCKMKVNNMYLFKMFKTAMKRLHCVHVHMYVCCVRASVCKCMCVCVLCVCLCV